MSLQTRLQAFITAVGADVKALQTGKANTSHAHATSDVTSLLATVRDSLYPVGAIYTSVVSTNPGSLFGGTWVAFGTGRIPIGVTSDPDHNLAGAEDIDGSTSIIANNLPPHTHTLGGSVGAEGAHVHNLTNHVHTSANLSGGTAVGTSTTRVAQGGGSTSSINASGPTGGMTAGHNVGAGTSHTHTLPAETGNPTANPTGLPYLPPVIAVYMWKRTA